jgi:putative phosphoesterase
MDRLGIVADIHGNLVALETALTALEGRGVERFVCLGDVASGPRPTETLVRLRALGCPVVMGNADAAVLDPPAAPPVDEDGRRWREIERWGHDRIGAEGLAFLADFAPTVALEVGGVRALACHGTPRSFNDVLGSKTPDDDLDAALAGEAATIVLAGHTHRQMLRRHRGMLLVNPGSVGLPYDPLPPSDDIRNPPWAELAVLEVAGPDDLAISFLRIPYDLDRLRADVLASGMPHAEWLLADWRA